MDTTDRGTLTGGVLPLGDQVLRVAVAVASAVEAQDLVERLASALGDGARPIPVRLWSVRERGSPIVLAEHSVRGEVAQDGLQTIMSAALEETAVRSGSTALIPLGGDEESFVLEIDPAPGVHPGILDVVGPIVAARLWALREAEPSQGLEGVRAVSRRLADTEAVIAAFAAEAKRLIDHDRLSVYMLTPDGLSLERFAVATSPVLSGEHDTVALNDMGLSYVLTQNRPIVSDDLAVDPRLEGQEDAIIAAAGFHGLVSVPLRVANHPIGLLNFVSRRAGFYTDEDAAIAQQIADQIVIFLQNLRIEQRVRLSISREAARQERNRIAHELHDTLAQSLTAMIPEFDLLADRLASSDPPVRREVTEMRARISGMLDELRRSLLRARPFELENRSLSDAIATELESLETDQGLRISTELEGPVDGLPPEIEVTVFRIVQEAIANIRKHARAQNVDVRLRVTDGVRLSIEDDGVGGVTSDESAGFGLRSMRERAEEIGGHFVVSSRKGEGTNVLLRLDAFSERTARPAPRRRTATQRRGGRVVRVLIVDDHPMFREALGTSLSKEDDIRVVGDAGTAAEALRAAKRLRPDLVILDMELPDASGTEVARSLVELERPPAVLILSAFADNTQVVAAMKVGARGYLAKSVERDRLLESVRAVANGSTVFDSSAASGLWAPPPEQPTRRELEVLSRIAEGKTNFEIANELCIAKKTVERIVATATVKLRARNRTHAVTRAIALRMISAKAD